MIYVLCPGYFKTGGTELAHQLVYQLKAYGVKAEITYYLEGKNHSKYQYKINPDFERYVDGFCFLNDIEDIKENSVIFPETVVEMLSSYKYVKKYIWWMSVDNFSKYNSFIESYKIRGVGRTVFNFLKCKIRNKDEIVLKADMHLCQSKYAIDYLRNKGIVNSKIVYLSDYINESYRYIEENSRKNNVLYNPSKGYSFTKKIMKMFPNLEWIPIQNMSTDEVKVLLSQSKVYIDFGNHPGKDRLPREAALLGCCIITGKRGAAKYDEDVSIPAKYKFDDVKKEIEKIGNMIKECIDNYEINIKEFEDYRKKIANERKQFEKDVYKVFVN